MALTQYRDCSTSTTDIDAGFQFEFTCSCCGRRWMSPFKPYRTGQLAAIFSRFLFLLPKSSSGFAGRAGLNLADVGNRSAHEAALREAVSYAERVFADCRDCNQSACEDCRDPSTGVCKDCREKNKSQQRRDAYDEAQDRAAHVCPNCQTPSSGGRFCAECGFDMAATHKSCPGCGAMVARNARFCTDCGHSF